MIDVSMNDNLKYPWQSPLLAAVTEFNPNQLTKKIAAAEDAIAERLLELNGSTNPEERLALHDAQSTLRVLKVVK